MKRVLPLLLFLFLVDSLTAQEFEAGLQLRPRFEFRNGFKSLLPDNADPAVFISQRSRVNLGYEQEIFKLKMSFQNIHLWGDIPTTAISERTSFKFFEAYAEYAANELLSFRLGRQVLSYDNQRIFGGLDWAQQGQSHDAFLITWLPAAKQKLEMGLAFNAEAETLADVPYTVNSYQNMQFVWYNFVHRLGSLSFLFLNNGYEVLDPVTQASEIQYLQTFGSFLRFNSSGFSGDLSAYAQRGESAYRRVEAYYAGANINYSLTDSWRTGLGAEYLSGTDRENSAETNRSFFPLFGTNHAFNGFMDYFYVGNHQNSVGLLDVYGKWTFVGEKIEFSVIPHLFWSAAEMGQGVSPYLGTEIDLAGTYRIQQEVILSFGYSQMFGTQSLELLKRGDHTRIQNWVWAMVSFQPSVFRNSWQ